MTKQEVKQMDTEDQEMMPTHATIFEAVSATTREVLELDLMATF